MSKEFITTTKNGFNVYVETVNSHAATHLQDHPELFDLIKEVLSEYSVNENKIRFETDMGRDIGLTDLVETTDADDVFYAKRPNREKYTRFVNNTEPRMTHFVTIELNIINDTDYEVFTAFIGRLTPPFPYGKDDSNEQARTFWNNHALVTGNQEYLLETVTTECPW